MAEKGLSACSYRLIVRKPTKNKNYFKLGFLKPRTAPLCLLT
ncbi:hypothetical protein PSE_p0136 (plasmid) [Pseudovibrio sp. FO-BEG1]|nr:hypothetical protein PSE_p0136 [Pseudovibrio sp. FO-BEG1]